jgi:hypothetical protein
LLAAAVLALRSWPASRNETAHSLWFMFLAYCFLLAAPASQVYRQVDMWQDLAKISRAIQHDAVGRPLILLAPDETTRAIVDMYARTSVDKIDGPINAAALVRVRAAAAAAPNALFLVQVRSAADLEVSLPWMQAAALKPLQSYSLPHGRRYALLQVSP